MRLVVRCGSGEHRVALDPKRFWFSATCPKCQAPVDPTRLRRVMARLRLHHEHSAPTRTGRLVWLVVWATPWLALSVALGLRVFGDRWWPATLLLFGPRWLLVVPLVLLALTAIKDRRRLLPLGAALLITAGPILGFQTGWTSWLGRGDEPTDLRVVTFNAEGGEKLDPGHIRALRELEPDIIAIQECPEPEQLAPPGEAWSVHRTGGSICLMSRYPIDEIAQQDREAVGRAGGSGWVVRYSIRSPAGLIHLTNVHLDTPRSGLERVLDGRLREGIARMNADADLRDIESTRARRWAEAEGGPMLVAGDFNMPVESTIYDRHWSDLTNAFSKAGLGFGSTRLNGWIRVRIDHVLVGPQWRVVRAFVGPDLASDHRPMVTDIRLRD